MKALVWEGVNELAVTSVPDPRIRIRQDAILKVNIAIDRYGYRLEMTEREVGCEVLDYERTDVDAELRERTGGRGPDVCIEAVGLEAHTPGPQYRLEQVKQQLRLETDRPHAVRQAILSCRKGGSLFVLGVFSALVDRFPLGR